MSEDNVRAFFKKMEEDEELLNRYKTLLGGVKPAAGATLNEADAIRQVVEFGSQNGYAFTEKDLTQVGQQMKAGKEGELSDEQLEAVAGGGWGFIFILWSGGGGPEGNHICVILGFPPSAW